MWLIHICLFVAHDRRAWCDWNHCSDDRLAARRNRDPSTPPFTLFLLRQRCGCAGRPRIRACFGRVEPIRRHGRVCCGHPRLSFRGYSVDGDIAAHSTGRCDSYKGQPSRKARLRADLSFPYHFAVFNSVNVTQLRHNKSLSSQVVFDPVSFHGFHRVGNNLAVGSRRFLRSRLLLSGTWLIGNHPSQPQGPQPSRLVAHGLRGSFVFRHSLRAILRFLNSFELGFTLIALLGQNSTPIRV
jgi:hypothetical protein